MRIYIKIVSLVLIISHLITILSCCTFFQKEQKIYSLKIGSVDISEFRIVYADTDPELLKWENYLYGTDYEFDKITAYALKDQISELTGNELEVVMDSESDPVPYEILVGKTTRNESLNAASFVLSEDDRLVRTDGTKLVLFGGSFGSTFHCVDLLFDEINKMMKSDKQELLFSADFEVIKSYDFKNLAFFCDGLLCGENTSCPELLSFYSVLKRVLWQDYSVKVYFTHGISVRNDLGVGESVSESVAWQELIDDCDDLDTIVLSVGSYDAAYKFQNSVETWGKNDDAIFITSYRELVESLYDANKEVEVYICTSPLYAINGVSTEGIASLQVKAADDSNAELIDLYGYLLEFYGEYTSNDCLYPDDKLSCALANKIANTAKNKS